MSILTVICDTIILVKSLHLDPKWLREQYEVNGLSTYDIAKIVHRDPKRIYEKLVDFGIPTRPRGHNLTGLPGSDSYVGPATFAGHHHTAETRRILSIKASVPKPYLRGSGNGMYGRTGATNPHWRGGGSPERQRLYCNAEWKATRKALGARDQHKCVKCGVAKRGPKSLHAHHIKPWTGNAALRFDISNLVTLCHGCHSWVHSRANTGREYL